MEISDQAERLQKLSEKHLQALKDGVTSLIVTPTHEEGRCVTTVVRDQMKQEGLITGQEHVAGRLQKLNLSESQQRDSMNYEHGCVVVFHKRSPGGFKVGEQWAVSRRDQEGTVIVQRNGQEKPQDLDTAQNFKLYAAASDLSNGRAVVGGGVRARCTSLSATDARTHPQHPQPAANLQHDIEPPLRPTLEQKQERGISI